LKNSKHCKYKNIYNVFFINYSFSYKMRTEFETFLVKFFVNSLISFYKKLENSEDRFGIACAFFEKYFGNDLLENIQKQFLNVPNIEYSYNEILNYIYDRLSR